MKVTSEALEMVKENRDCRNELAFKHKVHSGSIDRWIRDNEENGKLTTALSIEIISRHTKLSKKQILTKEVVA
jgi:hypothetical protein